MAIKLVQRLLSRQLGNPSGLLGGVVANQLNERNGASITAAVDALGCTGGERVADIGFGGGIGLGLLLDAVGADGRVHGIEPSPSMVARARKTYASQVAGGQLVLADGAMDSLPVEDGELDGWISLNTIYFIPKLEEAFAEAARVLAPSGRGVLGVADPDWLGRQPFAEHGFIVRPLDEVTGMLEAAGLAVDVKTLARPGSDVSYNLLICTRAG
ncbi:methyltransferase domain-containing protein [Aeromicrobium terrae]|uniref:Methyltransferase domain-containing protein n=1 Tax=Aeromicrobium terrae TaxID=2498846 RepID=A0A5C8NI96_9ACTN|nr:methyltransferase domain-containing protein [Aeromicrobium terrae]TXL60902.1 methyltransferase domain-containing protein [Aeromicrobium terrae]